MTIARANMLFYTKKAATVAVVILMTIALCSADIQELRTEFVKSKVLSTSYATKQHISKLNCVQWCSRDRQVGKCKTAGYNKYSKECKLSMDHPDDLMDVADEMSGVFVLDGDNLLNYKYHHSFLFIALFLCLCLTSSKNFLNVHLKFTYTCRYCVGVKYVDKKVPLCHISSFIYRPNIIEHVHFVNKCLF